MKQYVKKILMGVAATGIVLIMAAILNWLCPFTADIPGTEDYGKGIIDLPSGHILAIFALVVDLITWYLAGCLLDMLIIFKYIFTVPCIIPLIGWMIGLMLVLFAGSACYFLPVIPILIIGLFKDTGLLEKIANKYNNGINE